jgi:hypothetical protein
LFASFNVTIFIKRWCHVDSVIKVDNNRGDGGGVLLADLCRVDALADNLVLTCAIADQSDGVVGSALGHDGRSIIGSAAARLDDIADILVGIRGLAVQSAGDGIAPHDRALIHRANLKLQGRLVRIATRAALDDIARLSGAPLPILRLGIDEAPPAQAPPMTIHAASFLMPPIDFGVDPATSQATLPTIDHAIDTVATLRAYLRAPDGRITSSQNVNSHAREADITLKRYEVDSVEGTIALSNSHSLLRPLLVSSRKRSTRNGPPSSALVERNEPSIADVNTTPRNRWRRARRTRRSSGPVWCGGPKVARWGPVTAYRSARSARLGVSRSARLRMGKDAHALYHCNSMLCSTRVLKTSASTSSLTGAAERLPAGPPIFLPTRSREMGINRSARSSSVHNGSGDDPVQPKEASVLLTAATIFILLRHVVRGVMS